MGISSISETAAPYSNEVIFLFMGGFLIGLGIEKWGLHKRIALKIVSYTGSSGNKILLGFILSTGFISMWLSNTATTMMMYPIAISVISVVINMHDKEHAKRNFALAMMISIAYASNFGGIATIIGTPPNVAYASYISKKYQVDISFFDWMLVAMPVAILLLILLFFVLVFIFPNHIKSSIDFENMIAADLNELGPMSIPEKRVLIIFLITASLWIFRSLINQMHFVKLDDSMIAIFGAVLMFAVPAGNDQGKTERLLTWHDTSKMAWGILLLFGGGIALAGALEKSGIIQMIGTALAGNASMTVFSMIVVQSFFIGDTHDACCQLCQHVAYGNSAQRNCFFKRTYYNCGHGEGWIHHEPDFNYLDCDCVLLHCAIGNAPVIILGLCFFSKCQIACITQSGYNVSFCGQFFIDIATPYGNLWFISSYELNALGAGYHRHNMHLSNTSLSFQEFDGFHQ